MDAIGQLTSGMAHDFNNMIGVIIGNLDLLKPVVGADALASELCAEARDGAIRCADLIRRLLAFARRQPLRPAQTDVNALVSELSRLLGRTLGEHVMLTLDLDAALWPVKVDASQLEAALVNLATNARDAMPKGGQLTIATRNATLDAGYAAQHADVSAGDYAVIEVSDTGTGIAPEIVGRIFEPFFTTKASGQGTGLGLSMAFGFVKQSGGHLSVYSEPGLSTTFRIYLPRGDGGETATADRPDPGAVVGGHETILVVEDNAQLRRTAERQLTEMGYTVRESDSAAPALAILSGGEKVDLLFTDIVMPGTMDGLELANQASRLRPGLRVLLTSGFPGGHGADQRLADSPFRLLGKPYSFWELGQAVRMVLDKADPGVGSAAPASA
jgi:CheY-like chemotaxis protein